MAYGKLIAKEQAFCVHDHATSKMDLLAALHICWLSLCRTVQLGRNSGDISCLVHPTSTMEKVSNRWLEAQAGTWC